MATNFEKLANSGKLKGIFRLPGTDYTPKEVLDRRKEMEKQGFVRAETPQAVPVGADSRWEQVSTPYKKPTGGKDSRGMERGYMDVRELFYRPTPPAAAAPAQQSQPAAAVAPQRQNDPPPRFSVTDYTQSGDTTRGFAGSYVDSMLNRGSSMVSGVEATASPDYDAFLQRKSAEDARVAAQAQEPASTDAATGASGWEPGERGRMAYNERETTRAGELAARPFNDQVPESQRFADSPEFRASLKEREDRLNRTYGDLFS